MVKLQLSQKHNTLHYPVVTRALPPKVDLRGMSHVAFLELCSGKTLIVIQTPDIPVVTRAFAPKLKS